MIRPNDFRVSKVKNEKHYAPFSAIDIANIFESEISVNIDIDAALAGHTSNDYKLPLVLCALRPGSDATRPCQFIRQHVLAQTQLQTQAAASSQLRCSSVQWRLDEKQSGSKCRTVIFSAEVLRAAR